MSPKIVIRGIDRNIVLPFHFQLGKVSVSSGSVSWESGAYNVSKGEFVLCGCTSGQCSHSKDMKYSCSVKWPHRGLVSFHFMRKPRAACGVGNRNHKLSSPPSSPGKTENCQIGTNFKMGREFGHWYLRSGNSGSKNFISVLRAGQTTVLLLCIQWEGFG